MVMGTNNHKKWEQKNRNSAQWGQPVAFGPSPPGGPRVDVERLSRLPDSVFILVEA